MIHDSLTFTIYVIFYYPSFVSVLSLFLRTRTHSHTYTREPIQQKIVTIKIDGGIVRLVNSFLRSFLPRTIPPPPPPSIVRKASHLTSDKSGVDRRKFSRPTTPLSACSGGWLNFHSYLTRCRIKVEVK